MQVAVIYNVPHGEGIANLKAAIQVGDYSWAEELLESYGRRTTILEYVD